VSSSLGTATTAGPKYCVNHPRVETGVSCSNCGVPICPDCMVPAPVGIKCRECARMPRSARVRLRPDRAAKAAGTSFGIGTAVGALLLLGGGTGIGFLTFIVAYFVGMGIGRATLRASGVYRSSNVGWIAAAGAGWAYVLPGVLLAVTSDRPAVAGVQGLGVLIAGFIAYREAS
jgi:hypothetical protein